MRADELMRRLISGELTNYSVVRTSLEPLQQHCFSPHLLELDVREEPDCIIAANRVQSLSVGGMMFLVLFASTQL
jgi:hypothetical protein